MVITRYCPIHEYEVLACGVECFERRQELSDIARQLSMYWADRRRGVAPMNQVEFALRHAD